MINFITDSLEDEAVLCSWISSYHTCIVDPPRKGLRWAKLRTSGKEKKIIGGVKCAKLSSVSWAI